MAKPRHVAGEAGVWRSTDRLQPRTLAGQGSGLHPSSIDFEPPATRQTLISRALELEILPRLVMARKPSSEPQVAPLTEPSDEVLELTRLVLRGDEAAPHAFVESLLAAGWSIETLFLDLLTPTARHLGDLWVADLSDFTSVTLGAWQLQRIVRRLAPEFEAEAARRVGHPTFLLTAVFGDQHTMGLDIVATFFRRSGWDVTCVPSMNRMDLIDMVRTESFTLVGLSLASETRLDDLSACIRSIRTSSRNRNVGIMVGGPAFNGHPEYVAQIGADLTACDGRQATLQAERFVHVCQTH